MRSNPVLERNKDVVERFFHIAGEGAAAALPEVVAEDYVEHADMPDRRDGLASTVATNTDKPVLGLYEEERHRIRGELVRMVAERDHVWTFATAQGPEGRVGRIDMFRLRDALIAEHWSVVEQTATDRQNPNDPYATGRGAGDFRTQPRRITTAATEEEIARNRRAARMFYDNMAQRSVEGLGELLREDYIQHHPLFEDGFTGFADRCRQVFEMMRTDDETAAAKAAQRGEPIPPKLPYGPIRTVAEGDWVWVFVFGGERSAQHNQFRVESGRLAEHFGIYESHTPGERPHTNNRFGFGRSAAFDFSE